MSKYEFPGDIYNVKNDHNGNDMILDVYQYECQYSEWDENMVPFYGIGNGDYIKKIIRFIIFMLTANNTILCSKVLTDNEKWVRV